MKSKIIDHSLILVQSLIFNDFATKISSYECFAVFPFPFNSHSDLIADMLSGMAGHPGFSNILAAALQE